MDFQTGHFERTFELNIFINKHLQCLLQNEHYKDLSAKSIEITIFIRKFNQSFFVYHFVAQKSPKKNQYSVRFLLVLNIPKYLILSNYL